MKNDDFEDVFPTYESNLDKAFRVGHAVSSLIPTGAAIFESLITNPTQKRTKLWMEQVISKLAELDEGNKIDLKELSNRPEFSAIFLRMIQEVEISSQQRKLEYLGNFVINSAQYIEIDEDLLFILSDALKTLTPSHISVLTLYAKPELFNERFKQIHNLSRGPHSGGFTHLHFHSVPNQLAQIFHKNQSEPVILSEHDRLLEEHEQYWQLIYQNVSSFNLLKINKSIHNVLIPPFGNFSEKDFKVELGCSITSLGLKLLKLLEDPTSKQ